MPSLLRLAISRPRPPYGGGLALLALLLAIAGGVVLATTTFVELEPAPVLAGLVGWVASLGLVFAEGVRRARRDHSTVIAAAARGVRQARR